MVNPGATLEQKRREFEKARLASVPAEWDRLTWVADRELAVKGNRRIGIDTGTAHFYRSACRAFFSGSYLGSILLAAAACERVLRHATLSTEDPELYELIETARHDEKVSEDMVAQLHRVRRLIRNPVAHADEIVFLGFLGMERVNAYTWRVQEGRSAVTVEEAAREAIETFLRLLSDLYDLETRSVQSY